MPPYTRTRKRALAQLELESDEIEVTWTGRKRGKVVSNPEPMVDSLKKIKSLDDVSQIFKSVIKTDLCDLESSLRLKQKKILQLEEKLITNNARIMDLSNENSSLADQLVSLRRLQSETSREETRRIDSIEKVLNASRQSNESLSLEITELKKKLQQTAAARCKETMMERETHR